LQATGVKGEVATEPASKRQKTGIASDVAKAATTRSADPGAGVASPHGGIVDKNKRMENIVSSSTKTSTVMALQESAGSKQSIHPLAPVGPPFLMNKYKLDNRPTAFKIISPLPAGLANVSPSLPPSLSLYIYIYPSCVCCHQPMYNSVIVVDAYLFLLFVSCSFSVMS
jgi:RNA-binding protein 26